MTITLFFIIWTDSLDLRGSRVAAPNIWFYENRVVPNGDPEAIQSYRNYKSARQGCQSTSSSDISYAFLHHPLREQDLVSRTIVECPSCFQFLLDQRARLPSYYNCEGESFLYLALIHERKSVARRLVRALTTDDLMSPMWLNAQRVGPSALDIALSDDFMTTQGEPWSYNMERITSTLDYHSFMFSALEKHPRKGRIERAYFENCNREPPGIL
jgi:hypothetical protein